MPTIHVEYDDAKVPDADIERMSKAVIKIVQEVTGIEDVFVYANSARIKVQIAPIEIFMQMSAHKIKDLELLFAEIKDRIHEWKSNNHFTPPHQFHHYSDAVEV